MKNKHLKLLFYIFILACLIWISYFVIFNVSSFLIINFPFQFFNSVFNSEIDIKIPPPYEKSIQGVSITRDMSRVMLCESGFRQFRDNGELVRGKAGEIGIAQFKRSTFIWMSDLAGLNGNIENPYDQIELMAWAFKNNYQSHWTCK